jgi:preprotein translocase subunit SecA
MVYTERRKILEGADLKANVLNMIDEEIERVFDAFAPGDQPEDWDIPSLLADLKAIMPLPPHFNESYIRRADPDALLEEVIAHAHAAYEAKEKELGADKMRTLERLILLGTIDRLWVYHLTALEELRQGIGLAGYGQRDPLVEFKREAHDMYQQLTEHIRQNVVRQIFHVTLAPQVVSAPQPPRQTVESGPAKETPDPRRGAATSSRRAPAATVSRKVGRNDPCPCGSGKKYKKCHGAGGMVA